MKRTFVQTDKPVYKPGQIVKARIVTLDQNFIASNESDPKGNHIGQWLNVTPYRGIVDLSFPLAAEAPLGEYTINMPGLKNTFNVEEYVVDTEVYNLTLQNSYQFSLDAVASLEESGTVTRAAELPLTVPDTITDWKTMTFYTSEHSGLGISETVSLQTFKPFFVEPALPCSVIRGGVIPPKGQSLQLPNTVHGGRGTARGEHPHLPPVPERRHHGNSTAEHRRPPADVCWMQRAEHMVRFAPNVFITRYLEETGQRSNRKLLASWKADWDSQLLTAFQQAFVNRAPLMSDTIVRYYG
ncbi:Alpha-2-macroglobulin-like protein 1 [Chelonia mydas]|uniref:Alpha-2-macroglobulin-like protein 1 n=1 Tax=Chelonia mydas TaxID=8469 RepID=M7BV29_CHEMY|nr:Alpha-2-macroglobulin-like protein 1 [Chelonia mydas]